MQQATMPRRTRVVFRQPAMARAMIRCDRPYCQGSVIRSQDTDGGWSWGCLSCGRDFTAQVRAMGVA